ncbi:coleoptile phototropism protein 1-like [Punica granatum]|uniref:Coleoptile phototropism protein 1-like n=4 Tax=Punica granatum TaxID=22663 RepID=A0A218X185_PUNGR|nr:coleoptile phototropism protein 1-like [Punica granatum]OWM78231.1 hypothetical protein CDL15_Pgr015050 [Punica granatum]
MKKITSPESAAMSEPFAGAELCWFDDACILDMDYFVQTLSGIKAKGVRPDLIGSIIAHYASKWLPDLSGDDPVASGQGLACSSDDPDSPESLTAQWMKKRFFVETLVGILPPEKDSVPCNFLLRLLRTACMVGADPSCLAELEQRVAGQLEGASLKELMIPCFSHTCGMLLDVGLVMRLVKRFVAVDEAAAATRSGAALVKVAKLIDGYLAEAALEPNLTVAEFVALARALPSHARAMDDGLYRAIDTYLKVHPSLSKQERKALCRLMDSRKLSAEASIHATHNERLPIRAVIQVIFSEHNKLSQHLDWSGSFNGSRSPNASLEQPMRCVSKREATAQQAEIRKLREDVNRLQGLCNVMQFQIDRLQMEKKKGFFRWKKLGLMPSLRNLGGVVIDKVEEGEGRPEIEVGLGRFTPVDMKTRLVKGRSGRTLPKWRKSMS